MKNEKSLKLFVNEDEYEKGIWNPYYYRGLRSEVNLSDYVIVRTIKKKKLEISHINFEAINYGDIIKGNSLIFNLKKTKKGPKKQAKKLNVVGEQAILFGTMRAYLANIIVTPRAAWIGMEAPQYFPVKSEFVEVIPKDNLVYFWWAYFHRQEFLDNLPKGSGGTRPRVKPNMIESMPVCVPNIDVRREMNTKLSRIAELDWKSYEDRIKVLDYLELCFSSS